MTNASGNFSDDRLTAAQAFAHTMIVVDDEAGTFDPRNDLVPTNIQEPSRRKPKPETKSRETEKGYDVSHPLDAKLLVDNALALGLVCAIVQPSKTDHVVKSVSKAAERADIISLDWQMHGNSGDVAKSIINQIIKVDSKNGGRLRLISIYTGVWDRNKILTSILEGIPNRTKTKYNIRIERNSIVSNNGLRIIWLFKGDGVARSGPIAASQVMEKDLPSRLQQEFAELSQGLLSNVALATIASVRNATHHVLGKFTGEMDGPYFHHRAFLPNPIDAEDYAVSVVLSELKSAVSKQEVGAAAAGPLAIEHRISDMIGNDATSRKLHINGKDPIEVPTKNIISIAINGWEIAKSTPAIQSLGKKNTENGFSGLFADNYKKGRESMMAFASLTGVRSYPASLLQSTLPKLDLGSVIKSPDKQYLLCLQATCDTVRINPEMQFYFVPLTEADENGKPAHVVPVRKVGGTYDYVGLVLEDKAYTKAISLTFSSSGEDHNFTVRASPIQGKPGLHFKDVCDDAYEWIANLKQRRAMRSAQGVGQDMSRIGFDEFEPFRPNP